jgi:hypothetical protein
MKREAEIEKDAVEREKDALERKTEREREIEKGKEIY